MAVVNGVIEHNDVSVDLEKLKLSVTAATNTPCDPLGYRQVRISVRDADKKTMGIHCVQLSDAGVCCDFEPPAPGRYTLNLSYTFDVAERKPVEAKMLIMDGRFGKFPGALSKCEDGSWCTVDTTVTNIRREVIQEEEESIEMQNRARKVSLAKQLHRRTTLAELVGAEDVASAARKFHSLEEVTDIMRKAGLKSSNLIFGVDYTASNRTQGHRTFGGKSLHRIDHTSLNPYQQVIAILGKTLEPFSNQGSIPAFGFGDFKTEDHSVFSIQGPNGVCKTFREVLEVYNTMTPKITLSGPTNFAPMIRQAMKICQETKDYYLLVIVADGQVNNEKDTVQAIVEACHYPISIVVVGVGDGPWEMMGEFDERIPARDWDNFNFVNFHMITEGEKHPEATFAVHALSEIPDQYETICRLGLLD